MVYKKFNRWIDVTAMETMYSIIKGEREIHEKSIICIIC